jgi:2'-5' RNA ligase
MRTFIACDIFHKGINEVVEELKGTGAKIKFIEPKNTHITLKFLGEIEGDLVMEIENLIERIFKGFFPLEAKLRQVGVFPNANYMRVVWIGIYCPELERLQKKLDQSLFELGFKKEKNFKLHLTIGRIRSAKNKQRLIAAVEKLKDSEIGNYTIDSVKLKKSELTPKGPIYTDLKVVR